MGPRSLDRGNVEPDWWKIIAIFLQWGRDLSIAEIVLTQAIRQSKALVFNGAAISRSRKWSLPSCWPSSSCGLQWGRDLSIAEMSRSRITNGNIVQVFNGAAISRSRKLAAG